MVGLEKDYDYAVLEEIPRKKDWNFLPGLHPCCTDRFRMIACELACNVSVCDTMVVLVSSHLKAGWPGIPQRMFFPFVPAPRISDPAPAVHLAKFLVLPFVVLPFHPDLTTFWRGSRNNFFLIGDHTRSLLFSFPSLCQLLISIVLPCGKHSSATYSLFPGYLFLSVQKCPFSSPLLHVLLPSPPSSIFAVVDVFSPEDKG